MGKTPQRSRYRIGVLMWLMQEFGRRVLAGVIDHAQQHPGIDVQLIGVDRPRPAEQEAEPINELDGLIAALEPHEMAYRRRHITVPIVDVPLVHASAKHLSVTPDLNAIARLAIEHFASLRLEQVALCGIGSSVDDSPLGKAFTTAADNAAMHVLPAFSHGRTRTPEAMTRWLSNLPLPVGIFCDKDGSAEGVVSTANEAGLSVPHQVAVLGFGNDPIRCMHNRPTLSSIAIPAEKAGQCAVDLLVRHLNGRTVTSVQLAPIGVVQRDSTRTVAIEDERVAQAVNYIRAHFAEPITAVEVARHVGMPRRTLTHRFGKAMGHSVSDEIMQSRLARATALLATTDRSIKSIALSLGEMRTNNFSRFIKHYTGLTPLQYRRKHRSGIGVA